ncbi:hypothetical protein D2T29_00560 [Sinirhodobacter populi]|uniref:Uncharacterized protein n=1 Tax=Paenirhodobacter populi TaxID=2306993 RepID=A0A443KPY1_9RHOB|nr:hypothetical protein [Sinirhodobacter populi]RWR35003.1 hypothetical protein D2T29_00560 [Sinirhodobacter populi]
MPQSQTGGIVAAFGERMAQLGQALEDERLGREMTRLKTGMTRDLGTLRLQVEEMGDPEQAGRAWDTGVAEVRSRYLDGQNDDGTPTVDPKLKEDFGLAFDDLSMSHGLAIGGRLMQLRQSQRMAAYYDYSNAVVSQAATTDPGTRDQLFADLDAQIDARVARGDITAEQGAVAKRQSRQTAENTSAITLMQEDPQGLVDMLDGGGMANLDPETRARYRASGMSEVERRKTAALKAAEAADKELRTSWGQRLDDISSIAGNGQRSVDEVWMGSEQVADMAKRDPDFARRFDKARAATQLRNDRPGIQLATPDQLNTMIEEEKARPLGAPWEAERLKILTAQRDKAVEGWRKDPIAFARQSDMKVPDLDLTDLDNVPAAIAQRATFAAWLGDSGYATDAAPLDKDEQVRLSAAISEVRDPEQRAKLTGQIAAAMIQRGADPRDIDALSKDPVTKWVSLSEANGAFSAALGGEILRGQEALAAKNLTLPPLKDRQGTAFRSLEDLFAGVDGGEQIQSELTAATDALYAARVRNIDPNSDLQASIWQQALHEVLGGTGAYGTSRQRGGVQNVNGKNTFLPEGISAGMVTSAIGALANDLRPVSTGPQSGISRGSRAPADAGRAERILKSIADGAMPGINGRALTPSDWQSATFAQVGPDSYALILPYAGGVQAQNIAGDGAYTFSMSKLLAGYGGGRR